MRNIEKELDRAHSLYCRLMWRKCVTCGSRRNLEPAHIFTRAWRSVRWDVLEGGNCTTQCHTCNGLHEENAYPLNHWYEEKFGRPAFEELYRRALTLKQWTNEELQCHLYMIRSCILILYEIRPHTRILRESDEVLYAQIRKTLKGF